MEKKSPIKISIFIRTNLCTLYFVSARIATNLMLTRDLPLLINYGVALTLNSGIILSALYFRKNANPTVVEQKSTHSSDKNTLPKGSRQE